MAQSHRLVSAFIMAAAAAFLGLSLVRADGTAEKNPAEKIVGRWSCTNKFNSTAVYTFTSDGTFSMKFKSEKKSYPGTWRVSDNRLFLKSDAKDTPKDAPPAPKEVANEIIRIDEKEMVLRQKVKEENLDMTLTRIK